MDLEIWTGVVAGASNLRPGKVNTAAAATDAAMAAPANGLTKRSPVFTRLMGIDLPPKQGKAILDYMDRIFDRDAFQASLSEAELDMRD